MVRCHLPDNYVGEETQIVGRDTYGTLFRKCACNNVAYIPLDPHKTTVLLYR